MPTYDQGQGTLQSYPTIEELFSDNDGVFVTKCVKLVASWYDYFADNNRQLRDDIYFLHIDQWSAQDRSARTLGRKPVMQFNYLRPVLLQMLGEQRTQEPEPITSPKNERVDTKMVELAAEVIKDTFYKNQAPVLFQTCFKYMISGGYSAIFHLLEYEPKTFNKYVKIINQDNVTSCFFDPNAKTMTKKDGRFCGFMNDIPKDEFHSLYPDANTDSSFPTFRNDPLYYNYWYTKDFIRVADLWIKLDYPDTIVRLSDGTDSNKKEAMKKIAERDKEIANFRKLRAKGVLTMMSEPPKLEIRQSREEICYKQFHVRMSYMQILEVEEWKCDNLNGVFADCDSVIIDGRQLTISFFRWAQDPQRYLNYLKSEAAETILNAHHLSWLGTPANVKGGLLDYWKNPQQNKTILLANYDEKGNLPQSVPPPQISPAFETQTAQVINDIQNTTGRYEASMGKQGNETSGVAVDKRALNSSMSSFVPFDNLKQVICESANIILAMQGMVHEDESTIRVRSKDNNYNFVKLNQKVGDKIQNNVEDFQNVGVEINVGASYAVQKMANFQMFMQLMQLNPEMSSILMDLAAENLDLDNINQVVTRIKDNIIPPKILAKEEGRPMPPPTPEQQMQQKAQQASMMLPLQEMQIKQQQAQVSQQKIQLEAQELAYKREQDQLRNQIDQEKMRTEIERAKIDAAGEYHDRKLHEMDIKLRHISTLSGQKAKTKEASG